MWVYKALLTGFNIHSLKSPGRSQVRRQAQQVSSIELQLDVRMILFHKTVPSIALVYTPYTAARNVTNQNYILTVIPLELKTNECYATVAQAQHILAVGYPQLQQNFRYNDPNFYKEQLMYVRSNISYVFTNMRSHQLCTHSPQIGSHYCIHVNRKMQKK